MNKQLTEQDSPEGIPETDGSLLQGVRSGDEQAMVALFDRHSPLVYAVALRVLGDPAAAEDVVQELFLRIWRKPPATEAPNGSLAGWFAVLARNRSIDQIRKRRPTESPDDVILLSGVDVGADGEHNLLLARARHLMDALPEEQQTVLHLAFFDGLSHAEIAHRLGSPLGTVKTRLRRAVLTLRKAAGA